MAEESDWKRSYVTKPDGTKWIVLYTSDGPRWEPAPEDDPDYEYSFEPEPPQPYSYDTLTPSGLETSEESDQDRTLTPMQQMVADILSELLSQGLEWAEPRVKAWAKDKAAPKVKSWWRGVWRRDSARPAETEAVDEASEVGAAVQGAELVVSEPSAEQAEFRLTSAEAKQHYEDLKALAQVMAFKTRMLSRADIVDEPDQGTALEQRRAAEAQLIWELSEKTVEALKSNVPILEVDSPDELASTLGLFGYQVREIHSATAATDSRQPELETLSRPTEETQ